MDRGTVISDILEGKQPGALTALMYEAATERMTAEPVRAQAAKA